MNEITNIFENGLIEGLKIFSSQMNWLFIVCIIVVSLVFVIPDKGKQLIKGNPRLIVMAIGLVLLIVFWLFGEKEHTVLTFISDIFAIFTATLIYIIGKFIITIKSNKNEWSRNKAKSNNTG